MLLSCFYLSDARVYVVVPASQSVPAGWHPSIQHTLYHMLPNPASYQNLIKIENYLFVYLLFYALYRTLKQFRSHWFSSTCLDLWLFGWQALTIITIQRGLYHPQSTTTLSRVVLVHLVVLQLGLTSRHAAFPRVCIGCILCWLSLCLYGRKTMGS